VETEQEVARYFDRLWPLDRSLTGEGVRQTLAILGELAPLELLEVPSGTEVFDWTVPPEWIVRDAFVRGPDGTKILDFRESNLRLVGYSIPFRGRLGRAELEAHLHSIRELPDAIPYVTSYYEPRWGFCLSQRERDALPEGDYEVVVDTEHVHGSLTIGECVVPGAEPGEVLLSTYVCHPSLANNELSGPLVAAFLARRIAAWPRRRLTYRFVFLPETIGSLTYLSLRGDHLRETMVAGYVVTCVGTPDPFTLKRSRRHESAADRAALNVLRGRTEGFRDYEFFPSGSDERQYCSPGFNLPVASVMRAMYGTYPEYHTSLDNRDLISFAALRESIDVYEQIAAVLDVNRRYTRRLPFGEPQLGRHGLYPTLSVRDGSRSTAPLLWLLNYADGDHDLIDISDRSGHAVDALAAAAAACIEKGLVDVV
jgi:aminopeptidase-like protein